MKCVETEAKQDIFAVLETCPKEVTGLLQKIEAGEINGSCYTGRCKCLLGTLTELKLGVGCFPFPHKQERSHAYNKCVYLINSAVREPSIFSPAELWFIHIHEGDTPATNLYARLASEWIQEWLESKGMLK